MWSIFEVLDNLKCENGEYIKKTVESDDNQQKQNGQ